MAKKLPIKQWHTVLCVIYHGIPALSHYREPILAIARNIALLKGIECAIVCGNGGWLGGSSLSKIDPSELEPDYIHFRSEKRPILTRVEFEKMIEPLLPSLIENIQAGFLYQYQLRDMPFPSVTDAPPFEYGLS